VVYIRRELNVPRGAFIATSVVTGIAMPLFSIAFGVIYGFLITVVYNLLASWVGCIRITVEVPESRAASACLPPFKKRSDGIVMICSHYERDEIGRRNVVRSYLDQARTLWTQGGALTIQA
jgi:hypothetical protein